MPFDAFVLKGLNCFNTDKCCSDLPELSSTVGVLDLKVELEAYTLPLPLLTLLK